MSTPCRLMTRSLSPALAVSLIGCASSVPPPTASDDAFSGPAISLVEQGGQHIARVQAPTPGWAVTLSRRLPGLGHRDAFLTLREPYPGVIYPQVIAEQNIATGIPSDQPIHVYARVLTFDAKASRKGTYFLAASWAPSPAPTPPESASPAPTGP